MALLVAATLAAAIMARLAVIAEKGLDERVIVTHHLWVGVWLRTVDAAART